MSYFEDDENNGSGSDAGSESGSDAGSEYNTTLVKPKSVITLEEEGGAEDEVDNGSEIADSDIDDDDDLAEGLEEDDDDDGEEEEDGKEGDKKDIIVEDGEEEITLPKKTKKVKIDSTVENKKADDDTVFKVKTPELEVCLPCAFQ